MITSPIASPALEESYENYNQNQHRFRIDTLRSKQDGRHFADDIFKRIFFIEHVWSSIEISLKFFP